MQKLRNSYDNQSFCLIFFIAEIFEINLVGKKVLQLFI